jgi:hypothetical protein
MERSLQLRLNESKRSARTLGRAITRRASMSDDTRSVGEPEPIPLGQRLLERPFLLLAAGLLVMFVFYTGWGLLELASLSDAPLP